jgi:hypothetical protein
MLQLIAVWTCLYTTLTLGVLWGANDIKEPNALVSLVHSVLSGAGCVLSYFGEIQNRTIMTGTFAYLVVDTIANSARTKYRFVLHHAATFILVYYACKYAYEPEWNAVVLGCFEAGNVPWHIYRLLGSRTTGRTAVTAYALSRLVLLVYYLTTMMPKRDDSAVHYSAVVIMGALLAWNSVHMVKMYRHCSKRYAMRLRQPAHHGTTTNLLR